MNWRKWPKIILWTSLGMTLAGLLAVVAIFWPFIVPLAFLDVRNASDRPVVVDFLKYAQRTIAKDLNLDSDKRSQTFCIFALPSTEIRLVISRPGNIEAGTYRFPVRQRLLQHCHRRITVGHEGAEISECTFYEGMWPPDCLSPFQ